MAYIEYVTFTKPNQTNQILPIIPPLTTHNNHLTDLSFSVCLQQNHIVIEGRTNKPTAMSFTAVHSTTYQNTLGRLGLGRKTTLQIDMTAHYRNEIELDWRSKNTALFHLCTVEYII